MGSANKRRRYIVTSSLIGWAHTQNDIPDIGDDKIIFLKVFENTIEAS